MKKIMLSTLATCALFAAGCGTYQVSEGVARDGSGAKKIIFPKQNKAWRKEGTFPNLENLRKIDKGMTKEDLYYLIGAPHFSEAQHADEWDYIFKFRDMQTRAVTICQYKILFDEHKKGQSFYWKPAGCAENLKVAQAEPQVIVKEVAAPAATKVEVISLSADALFHFDKWHITDIKPAGKASLMRLVEKIKQYELTNEVKLELIGHTDRLGNEMYNQRLSQRRANTVKQFLAQHGLNPSRISAYGAGESQPKTGCYGVKNRHALIACLQPNRRVEVVVKTF